MITDKDKKKLKHIPYRNAKLIQDVLAELGKHVYSPKTIANVFRGEHENLDIEEAFYILNERIALRKKQIKKPEAATPGSI
jgi:hypothetical protein